MSRHTEPSTIRLNAGGREFFRLELMVKNVTFAVTNGARFVHTKATDSGGAPEALVLLAIAPLLVQGVPGFPLSRGGLGLLLPHVSQSLSLSVSVIVSVSICVSVSVSLCLCLSRSETESTDAPDAPDALSLSLSLSISLLCVCV